MPELYIRKNQGWQDVADVVDVRVQTGRIVLEDGTTTNGDLVVFFMRRNVHCIGQMAMTRLVEMNEPRIVDFRVNGGAHLEMSAMLQDIETSEDRPAVYGVVGRVLGMRKIGDVVDAGAQDG